jgi:hypothetical protein
MLLLLNSGSERKHCTGDRKTIVGIGHTKERRESISERTDSLDAFWRTKEIK